MKEIQGKIKFGVIPVNTDVKIIDYGKTNLLRSAEDVDFIANKVTIEQIKTAVYLSEITEEQAAEFVECDLDWMATDHNGKPEPIFNTAKESLISLLKANDVYIKEWCMQPNASFTSEESDLYDKLPDDLLLIKL